ncbi:hypothetical protein DRH14_05365 [Candidatus Shapirobacteria bacterium]|nr:MAG: hypothetical protein DRH14_05365 [Candidatus Shapirobacteria bacterium]
MNLDIESVFKFAKHQKIINSLLEQKSFKPQSFSQQLAPELRLIFENVYISISQYDSMDMERKELEFKKVLKKLKIDRLKVRLKKLSQQITRLDNSTQTDQLQKVEEEYNLTIKKLAKLQS